MPEKEASLQKVTGEVEDLAVRVAELKTRFARQRASVKLRYYWELEYLRNRFGHFKHCVEALEEAGEDQVEDLEQATESAWRDVKHAADTLLAALPDARSERSGVPLRTNVV